MIARTASQPPRILFVRPDAMHREQLYALDHYAMAAAAEGFDVSVLGPRIPHSRAADIPSLNEYPPRAMIRRCRSLLSAVHIFRPDIVHVRNHLGASLVPLILKTIHPRGKAVLDLRTLATSPRKDSLFRLLRSINGMGYDHVFGLNRTILDAYVPHHPSTSLLPLGYDEEIFKPRPEQIRFRKGERLRCIYYGSMNKVRGLETLLNGVIWALESGVDLSVDFIGEGNDKQRLVKMIPDSYADRLVFHSFSSQGELAERLPNYHLGLAYVPANSAFLPNTPLKTVEMIASGLPVLATRTAGNEGVMAKSAGILADDSAASISLCLKRIYQNQLLINMSPRERSNTVLSFSWRKISIKYLIPVYKNLLNNVK